VDQKDRQSMNLDAPETCPSDGDSVTIPPPEVRLKAPSSKGEDGHSERGENPFQLTRSFKEETKRMKTLPRTRNIGTGTKSKVPCRSVPPFSGNDFARLVGSFTGWPAQTHICRHLDGRRSSVYYSPF